MIPDHIIDDFVTEVDGFLYFWPKGSTRGHFSAHHLREIADELDARNKSWNDEMNRYFDSDK